MATVLALVAFTAVVLGALLCLVWLLTRSPQMARELKAGRAENDRLRDLIGRLHAEAIGYADVNPVAQVFLDEITRAGMAPVQGRRSK